MTETPNWTNAPDATDPLPMRSRKQALARGFRCRCPNCGEGGLFGRFLKVEPECRVCAERLDGHRADDMPAYITIMIVGHIVVPLNLFFERGADWPLWWHATIWPSLTIILTLALMQPVKGALIGYQWALRMHGFDPEGEVGAVIDEKPTR
jgi:uncharacterized protein (DUF983 family)